MSMDYISNDDLPRGGNKGFFENHPGWGADGCQIRLVIQAHAYGSSRNGFACAATGGHCLPCDRCDARRADVKENNERMAKFGEPPIGRW